MMSSPPSAVGTTADELLVRTSVYPEFTFDFFLFDMESNTPVHVHSIRCLLINLVQNVLVLEIPADVKETKMQRTTRAD